MRLAVAAAAISLAALGSAAKAAPPQRCTGLRDDAQRLACYDAQHGRKRLQATERGAQSVTTPAQTPAAGSGTQPPPGRLSQEWDLDSARRGKLFRLRPYHPNYLLPVRFSDNPNRSPLSPASGHQVTKPAPYQSVEAKFQLSFKFKAAQNLIGHNGDLWFGYTQQSSWQVYNSALSSPFRETDYQPEAVFTWRTGGEAFGWHWRLVNLGVVHESNGQSLPLSRSWNRVYVMFGFEHGDWTVLVRPWYRLPKTPLATTIPTSGTISVLATCALPMRTAATFSQAWSAMAVALGGPCSSTGRSLCSAVWPAMCSSLPATARLSSTTTTVRPRSVQASCFFKRIDESSMISNARGPSLT